MTTKPVKPFYFIAVVWGRRYTNFLFKYCIASLLSPKNIPCLVKGYPTNKFIICATIDDWEHMQSIPMFKLLSQYLEIVFIRIPPCPEGTLSCMHMGIGHKLATSMAYRDKAYAAVLIPDGMVSDGTVAAMQRHAANGVQVMLVAALRFGREPLFKHLREVGIAADGNPITATGRQLVAAGIKSFHTETLTYEWDSPAFTEIPVAVWFRVPGEDGIIVHSLSWTPFLIDYSAVRNHDTKVLDYWTIDSDYICRNFGTNSDVYVVQDSDESMVLTWAPMGDRPRNMLPHTDYLHPVAGEWVKGKHLHNTISGPRYDDLKRELVKLPIYWHSKKINTRKWDAVKERSLDVINNQGLRKGAP